MAAFRTCVMCGRLTKGERADGAPICWRPCYQLLAMTDALAAERALAQSLTQAQRAG